MKTSGSVGRGVITFVGIFTTGLMGIALPSWGAHLRLPLLPGGLAIAAIYRWGWRMWIPALAAGVAFELSAAQPFVATVGVGAGLAAGGLLCAWLLRKYEFQADFGRRRDVLIFLLAVAAGMTVTPTVSMAAFILARVPSVSPDIVRWTHWWSNSAAGALLVGPALIAMSRQTLTRFLEQWVEGAGWLFGVAICCAVIVVTPGPVGRSVMVMFAILIIVVGAIRLGMVVAALGALAISSTTAFSLAFGFGMFGTFSELAGRLTLFSFSATLIAANLIITALLAERDAASLDRLRAERRYAQIFNGSPQAIWVHDPETLDFLLANEAAQRQYGWTLGEFLARNVSMLAPPGEPRILPRYKNNPMGVHESPAPFETRHVTRDGRVLEMEVWMRSINLGDRPAELVFAIDVSERRSFDRALIDALAGEQRRIAGEIHDGLGQELTGLALSLRALATRAERNQRPAAPDLDDLAKLATRCIEGAKRIVQGLSPLNDAGGSLEAALDALARRASLSGTPVHFRASGGAPLALDTEALDHFYRIAQEAVQNALKHAAAAAIDIELSTGRSDVRLSIVDNGRGLPSDIAGRKGLGMRTMHFRAAAIGGALVVESSGSGGTAVRCAAPQGKGAGASDAARGRRFVPTSSAR